MTAELSPEEAAKVAAFGLDVPDPVEQFKADTVARLRLQEQASRDEAARIRAHYDEAGPGAPGISEVLRQEARAGAFASAVEIMEQVAF